MMKDPKYYNIDVNVLAEELGDLNMYVDLTILIFRPFMGLIIDLYGRKLPIFAGTTAAAIALTIYPNLKHLYPWYFVTYTIEYIFLLLLMETPLIPDYVDPGSIGLASSYGEIFVHAAIVIGGTCMLQLSHYIAIPNLFYMWSSIFFVTGILLFFMVKNVQANKYISKQELMSESQHGVMMDQVSDNGAVMEHAQVLAIRKNDAEEEKIEESDSKKSKRIIKILYKELAGNASFFVSFMVYISAIEIFLVLNT